MKTHTQPQWKYLRSNTTKMKNTRINAEDEALLINATTNTCRYPENHQSPVV